MTNEQLRAALQAHPFRPFTLSMADGRALPVPHKDFLSASPGGRTIIVYRIDESFSIVDLLLVNELDFQGPAGGTPTSPENNGAADA